MTVDTSHITPPISRRTLLRTTASATVGLAGILATKTPPLYAATRTLTMLTLNHFVPASDENLKRWAKEFEKANKCHVKIDFIAHRDTYAKVAKEQETRTGHDIVLMFFSKPHLHHEALETLDFMEDLGKKLGGWYDLARDAAQVEGRWVAMPWFYIPACMTYREDLYESCMTNEVLSWDDSSNNQAFMGGNYSWVHNAVSIYYVAKEKVPDIAKVTSHTLSPAGPAGEHGVAVPINYGIWQFAQEKELAKQFLQFLMDPQRTEENFHVTLTYNAPTYKAGDQFDWGRDPKTGMLKDYAKTAHLIGWPGPADRKAEQARAEWVIPNMFTYYATGQKSLEESVTWAEGELRRIYTAKA